jgi:hypothetical protein
VGSASVRPLLSLGNDKLGGTIHSWSIPAVTSCPGSSCVCRRVCYATHGRFSTAKSKEAMRWRLQQSKRMDFAERMIDEVYTRGVLVCRIHVAGDFYSPGYLSKWIEIAAGSPSTRFFTYTRSWRVAKIEPLLRAFAALDNVRLWYSADSDTGFPPDVPPAVQVAWLQDTARVPEQADLLFQTRGVRSLALPLVIPVCAQELPEGKARGVNCANCGVCWK